MDNQDRIDPNNNRDDSVKSSPTEPTSRPSVKRKSESVMKASRSPSKDKNTSTFNSLADLPFDIRTTEKKVLESSSDDNEVAMAPILDAQHRSECDSLISDIKAWHYKEKKKYVRHHNIQIIDHNVDSINSGIANFIYKQRSVKGEIPAELYNKIGKPASIHKRDFNRERSPLSQTQNKKQKKEDSFSTPDQKSSTSSSIITLPDNSDSNDHFDKDLNISLGKIKQQCLGFEFQVDSIFELRKLRVKYQSCNDFDEASRIADEANKIIRDLSSQNLSTSWNNILKNANLLDELVEKSRTKHANYLQTEFNVNQFKCKNFTGRKKNNAQKVAAAVVEPLMKMGFDPFDKEHDGLRGTSKSENQSTVKSTSLSTQSTPSSTSTPFLSMKSTKVKPYYDFKPGDHVSRASDNVYLGFIIGGDQNMKELRVYNGKINVCYKAKELQIFNGAIPPHMLYNKMAPPVVNERSIHGVPRPPTMKFHQEQIEYVDSDTNIHMQSDVMATNDSTSSEILSVNSLDEVFQRKSSPPLYRTDATTAFPECIISEVSSYCFNIKWTDRMGNDRGVGNTDLDPTDPTNIVCSPDWDNLVREYAAKMRSPQYCASRQHKPWTLKRQIDFQRKYLYSYLIGHKIWTTSKFKDKIIQPVNPNIAVRPSHPLSSNAEIPQSSKSNCGCTSCYCTNYLDPDDQDKCNDCSRDVHRSGTRYNCNTATVVTKSEVDPISEHDKSTQARLNRYCIQHKHRKGDFIKAEVMYDPEPYTATNRSIYKSVQGPTSVKIWRAKLDGPIILYVGDLVADSNGNYIGYIDSIRCGGVSNTISIIVQDGAIQTICDVSQIHAYSDDPPPRYRAQHGLYRVGDSPTIGGGDIEFASILKSGPAIYPSPIHKKSQQPENDRSSLPEDPVFRNGDYTPVLRKGATTVEPFGRRGGISRQTARSSFQHDMNMSMTQNERDLYRVTNIVRVQLDKRKFQDIPTSIMRQAETMYDPSSKSLMNWAQMVAPMFGLDNVMLISLDILKKYHHEPKSNTPQRSIFVTDVMSAFKRYDGDAMEIFDMCCRLWTMTIKARTKGKLMKKLYNAGSTATVFDLFNLIRVETKTALSLHQCQQFAIKILNIEWKSTESIQDLESKLVDLIEQLDATSDSIDGSMYVPQEHLIVARLMNQAEKRAGFTHFISTMRMTENFPATWEEFLKLLRSEDYRISLQNQSSATLNSLTTTDSTATSTPTNAPTNVSISTDHNTNNNQFAQFNTLNHQESTLTNSFENLNFNSISVDTLDRMHDHLTEVTHYRKLQDQSFNKLRKKSDNYSGTCNVCGMKDSHPGDECIYNFKSKNFANGRMNDRKPEERKNAFSKFRNSTPEHKAFYDKWEQDHPPKSLNMMVDNTTKSNCNHETNDKVNLQPTNDVRYGSMVHAMEPRNVMCSAEEMNQSTINFNKIFVKPHINQELKPATESPMVKTAEVKSKIHPTEASNYNVPDKDAEIFYTGIVEMFEDGALIQTYNKRTNRRSKEYVRLDITKENNLTLSVAWDTMVSVYASKHVVQPNDIIEYCSYAGMLERMEKGTPKGVDFSIPVATHHFLGTPTIIKDWRIFNIWNNKIEYKGKVNWSKRKTSISIQLNKYLNKRMSPSGECDVIPELPFESANQIDKVPVSPTLIEYQDSHEAEEIDDPELMSINTNEKTCLTHQNTKPYSPSDSMRVHLPDSYTPTSPIHNSLPDSYTPTSIVCYSPVNVIQLNDMDESSEESTDDEVIPIIENQHNQDATDLVYTGITHIYENEVELQAIDTNTLQITHVKRIMDVKEPGNICLCFGWTEMLTKYAENHATQPNDIEQFHSYLYKCSKYPGESLPIDFTIPTNTSSFQLPTHPPTSIWRKDALKVPTKWNGIEPICRTIFFLAKELQKYREDNDITDDRDLVFNVDKRVTEMESIWDRPNFVKNTTLNTHCNTNITDSEISKEASQAKHNEEDQDVIDTEHAENDEEEDENVDITIESRTHIEQSRTNKRTSTSSDENSKSYKKQRTTHTKSNSVASLIALTLSLVIGTNSTMHAPKHILREEHQGQISNNKFNTFFDFYSGVTTSTFVNQTNVCRAVKYVPISHRCTTHHHASPNEKLNFTHGRIETKNRILVNHFNHFNAKFTKQEKKRKQKQRPTSHQIYNLFDHVIDISESNHKIIRAIAVATLVNIGTSLFFAFVLNKNAKPVIFMMLTVSIKHLYKSLQANPGSTHLDLMVDSGASMNIEPSSGNVFDFKPTPVTVMVGDDSTVEAEGIGTRILKIIDIHGDEYLLRQECLVCSAVSAPVVSPGHTMQQNKFRSAAKGKVTLSVENPNWTIENIVIPLHWRGTIPYMHAKRYKPSIPEMKQKSFIITKLVSFKHMVDSMSDEMATNIKIGEIYGYRNSKSQLIRATVTASMPVLKGDQCKFYKVKFDAGGTSVVQENQLLNKLPEIPSTETINSQSEDKMKQYAEECDYAGIISKLVHRYHILLGHLNYPDVIKLLQQNGIKVSAKDKLINCDDCNRYKARRVRRDAHRKLARPRAHKYGEIIWMDTLIWTGEPSINGCTSAILFMDDFSRTLRVIGTKGQSAEESLLAFKAYIQIYLHNQPPRAIRSDSGTEFINELWADYCHSNKIEQQPNPAGSPNSNLIERYMQEIKKQIRVLLGGWSNSDDSYWLLAARYACFLRNRAPCDANDGISPHIYLKGQEGYAEWTFTLDRLSIFGVKGTILNQNNKLRSECIYVGFDENRLCPIVRNLENGNIISTNDAQFYTHPMRDPFSFEAPNARIELDDPSIDVTGSPEVLPTSVDGGENTSNTNTGTNPKIIDENENNTNSKNLENSKIIEQSNISKQSDAQELYTPEASEDTRELYMPEAIINHRSKGSGKTRILEVRIRWKGYSAEDDTWEFVSPSKPDNICLSSKWNTMIYNYNPRLLRIWSTEALMKSEKNLKKNAVRLYMVKGSVMVKNHETQDEHAVEVDSEYNQYMTSCRYPPIAAEHKIEMLKSLRANPNHGDLEPDNIKDPEPEIKLVMDNDGEMLTNLRVGETDFLFDQEGHKVEIKSFDVTTQQLFSLDAIYKTIKKKPFKRKPAEIVNGEITPTSVEEILKHPNKKEWMEAYYNELDNLKNAGTFKRVLRETYPNAKPLKWRLVCKIKTDQDGNTVRRKVRYTCRGDLTKEHIHYGETYSPTIQIITLRTILSIATTHNLKRGQVDITAAFLYGILEKVVLTEYPRYWDQFLKGNRSEIEEPNDKKYIALMLKSCYGLKDAASLFYKNLRKAIENMDFKISHTDNCFFYKGDIKNGTFIAICSFVDDLSIFASNDKLIKDFVDQLFKSYKGTQEADLKYIIGLEINESENELTIDQQKYVRQLLDRYKFNTGEENCHKETRVTPLPPDAIFSSKLLEGDELLKGDEITHYQSIVGGLLFLHSRPDVAHAVGKLCRFMHAPTNRHLKYAKHVLKYLRKHPTLGIKYNKDGDDILRSYTDSSYLDDPDSGKTTLGYVITLNGGPVAYKSRLSKLVLHSTCEAEYVAMYEGLVTVLQLRTLLSEIGIKQTEPTPMRCDNQAAVILSTADTEPPSYRHIAMRYHALREAAKYVAIRFIPTKENIADMFTKALPTVTLRYFIEQIMCDVNKDENQKLMKVNLTEDQLYQLFDAVSQMSNTNRSIKD